MNIHICTFFFQVLRLATKCIDLCNFWLCVLININIYSTKIVYIQIIIMYELHVYILMANKQAIYAFAAACAINFVFCKRTRPFISSLFFGVLAFSFSVLVENFLSVFFVLFSCLLSFLALFLIEM